MKKYVMIHSSFYLQGDANSFSKTVGSFNGLSETQADRLEKALRHLVALCNKDADPFGN